MLTYPVRGQEVLEYYNELGRLSGKPTICYNIPGLTGAPSARLSFC